MGRGHPVACGHRQLLQQCRATLPLSVSVPCPVWTAFCPPKLIPTHPGLGFTALVEALGHLEDTENLAKARLDLRQMKTESLLWWEVGGLRYWYGFQNPRGESQMPPQLRDACPDFPGGPIIKTALLMERE